MDLPALAADCEASAMRTRAWGETGRESVFALGGGEACFASASFFLAAGFRETLVSEAGGSGWFSAGDVIGDEILLRGLFLPEVDFAMGEE
jgi:hypothetical protein